MRKILLRMINPPLFVLLACLFTALQSSIFQSFPLSWIQPDILLAMVLWASFKRPFTEGGVLTLLIGQIAETHSSAPRGLFLTCYMAIFLGARLSARVFVLPDFHSWLKLTMIASVLWKAVGLIVLASLNKASLQWRHTLMHLFPDAVVAALVGSWIYRGLDRLDRVTHKNAALEQRLSDDLQLAEQGGA